MKRFGWANSSGSMAANTLSIPAVGLKRRAILWARPASECISISRVSTLFLTDARVTDLSLQCSCVTVSVHIWIFILLL